MSVLLVDSYDSFTFNLKNLIETSIGTKVYTIHNDTFNTDEYDSLDKFINYFDAIIIGPGPGDPRSSQDVGMIPYLLTKTDIPILGICLGFQCLCDSHGGLTMYLENVKHGQVYDIEVIGDADELLFQNLNNFKSVRYHSIYVKLNEENDLIIPLAYTDDDGEKILMAAKHKSFPHYGVQYHPESICSEAGDILMKNFWQIAKACNEHRVVTKGDLIHDEHVLKPVPLLKPRLRKVYDVKYKEISISNSNIEICDHLKSNGTDFLLLNSASLPGEWSIIGLPITNVSDVVTHSTQDPKNVILSKWNDKQGEKQTVVIDSIWSFIANYMDPLLFDTKEKANEFPFVGGLIGFFSYEEGEFIDLSKLDNITKNDIPDTKLCFIERMILHDLKNNKHYVVSISPNDEDWIDEVTMTLSNITPQDDFKLRSVKDLLLTGEKINVELPQKDDYIAAFQECQDEIQKGDSYELCLTTSTKLQIPSRISSWEMYKVLTKKNPSPYSCFLSFDDAELLSSSPERFLSWSDKFCQLRPIKGTVKKSLEMTLDKLTKLLKTPKEMGENLMIVDLIRHDLYTFLTDIDVVQLMTVEEYKTVYQLVSVINGSFKKSVYSGLDILSKSLPPGSMTGAPKKRSVEILQKLEQNQRRGIYSGVCGYYSCNNKSDWSVVIRSCFKYKDDMENDSMYDIWRIGAGGAITALSDCEAEWQEMELKLESALQAFKL